MWIGHGRREPINEMAKSFSDKLFAALLLATIVFSDVKGLPTSVLVDSKQQSETTKGNYSIHQLSSTDFLSRRN